MSDISESRWCCRCDAYLGIEYEPPYTTAGYYDVRGDCWSQFAYPGEDFICDKCMWVDPRFIKVYGHHE